MDKLFSIKDFAAFTGVKQSTLRYYDEIGLLSPACRGENNYRYYEPQQIFILNFINVLIDIGVPLAKIKDLMDTREPETVLELLNQQELELNKKLHELRSAFSIIQTYRKNIYSGIHRENEEMSVQELPETSVILGTQNDWTNQQTFYKPFINFCKMAKRVRINLRYPIGAYHSDFASFLEAPGKPHRFFSQDPVGNSKRRAGKYLVGYKYGYYGEFGDFAQKMASYAKEHNLNLIGPVFVKYVLDEVSKIKHEEYLAQIMVRVE